MAPISPEPARPRARRQPYVATCSPDELLGQIIQALLPKYNIDAPHLLALRQVVSSVVVEPRKPPTLKRTRPDRHIGELGSVYDTPRSSRYGPNGPPVSAQQSFFFHHQDPDFARLLPHIDRSRYEWPDEPASQSSSDSEEVPDSQESLASMLSDASAVASMQRSALLQPNIAPASMSAGRRRRSGAQTLQHERGICEVEEQASGANPSAVYDIASKGVPTSLQGSSPCIPAIVVTSPNSTLRQTKVVDDVVPVPLPTLHLSSVTIDAPNARDTRMTPESSFPSASPILVCADTQDTVNSTQQSEVFTQPDAFVNFTPPSQEYAYDAPLSEVIATDAIDLVKVDASTGEVPRDRPQCSPPPSQSAPFEPALGKRSRAGAGVMNHQAGGKRRKSTE